MKFEEFEAKFESNVNLQLKYSIIDKPEVFREKFECLLDILGLTVQDVKSYRLEDEYYDDNKGSIRHSGNSFRIRTGESDDPPFVVTIKSFDKSPSRPSLHRTETEIKCNAVQRNDLITNPGSFKKYFPDSKIDLKSKLLKGLSVINDRLAIEFSTRLAKWRMCYDRFYFFYETEGRFSPYFSEVEIERIGDSDLEDPQISLIHTALTGLFGLGTHKQSKSKRGDEFAGGDYPPITNICVVGFDIVGYSTMQPPMQLQSIQKLNKFAKEAMRELVGQDFHCIYIPTGDGMYLVLETDPKSEPFQGISLGNVLPMIGRVQEFTKMHNRTSPPDYRFAFRTGVHAGPVFRYTDINENLNYAGNGINLAARVLGFGSDWHILFSEQAKELFTTLGAGKDVFQNLGIKLAKHGVEIRLHNVFEVGKFGNPNSPT